MFVKNDFWWILIWFWLWLYFLLLKLLFELICRLYIVLFVIVWNLDFCKIYFFKDFIDLVFFFLYIYWWYVDSRDFGIFFWSLMYSDLFLSLFVLFVFFRLMIVMFRMFVNFFKFFEFFVCIGLKEFNCLRCCMICCCCFLNFCLRWFLVVL